jgi:hypothetical protein
MYDQAMGVCNLDGDHGGSRSTIELASLDPCECCVLFGLLTYLLATKSAAKVGFPG